ncbi:MAG TPA: HD domain-containing protein [Reyranella sp.]|nr:HD domain-containing protein [Reyranella sp.]
MNNDLVKLSQAADYAARQHAAHKRKGIRGEPYINHLIEVATLLAEATDGNDLVLVQGGYLHDTVEDTDTTPADLVRLFGKDVADLVAEVTDDKSLPQKDRKRLQVEHAPHLSPRGKLLKIADKTSNLRGIVSSPPKDWSRERLLEYIDWAEEVVRACRGANARLEAAFDKAHAEAIEHYKS